MKFICAQPAIDYYTWQVEVMINSFIDQGVDPRDIQIVCGFRDSIPENWNKLKNHYSQVRFYFYPDNRHRPGYISSIRPWILEQHWKSNPALVHETILYHDCDIALFKPLELSELLLDQTCYVSDTISYIGANYINSKGEHYLDLMTSIVGVDKAFVIGQEQNSGGAQYLLKKIPQGFWSKVYHDSENLFRMVNQQIQKDKPDHAIQIWCADMWAVLWNLWFYNKEVRVSDKMSFSWATSHSSELDKHPFYHNAGVTGTDSRMFFKGAFINQLPYHIKKDSYSSEFCSYHYAGLIESTAAKSILHVGHS